MIVGENKSGKSTLLNALAGRDVADVNDEPKTWCINVYMNTSKEPCARLVYPDRTEEVSIEKALEIRDSISAGEGSVNEESVRKYRDLAEIRWYLKIDWPKEGMMLIDTPGFNQLREDTGKGDISVSGVKGIRFTAADGFERYYEKADLVLWCFHYRHVGDSQVEEKLKAVKSQNKKIYGIVTQLDRVKGEKERERSFQKNNEHYKKYISDCLRSSLPPIFSDDTKEDIKNKALVRDRTVAGIKDCITYLLNESGKGQDLKLQSAAGFLKWMKKFVASHLKAYLLLYSENGKILDENLNMCMTQISEAFEYAGNDMGSRSDKGKRILLEETDLRGLWDMACGDMRIFESMLEKRIKEADEKSDIRAGLRELYDRIREVSDHGMRELRFKDVKVSGDKEIDSVYSAEENDILPKLKLPAIETKTMEGLGLVYDLLQLLPEGGILKSFADAFAGEFFAEKAIAQGYDKCRAYFEDVRRSCLDLAGRITESAKKQYGEAAEERFLHQTGKKPHEIVPEILKIETILTRQQMYEKDIPFYPLYDEYGHLCFLQSEYYCNTDEYRCLDLLKAAEEFLDYGISPLFAKRREEQEKTFEETLKFYDGRRGVDFPKVRYGDLDIRSDGDCVFGSVPVNAVSWDEGSLEAVSQGYRRIRLSYLEDCEKSRKHMAETAEAGVLEKVKADLEKRMTPAVSEFCSFWIPQLDSALQWALSCGMYSRLPELFDFSFFYLNRYQFAHGRDNCIELLIVRENEEKISEILSFLYPYVTVEGKPFGKRLSEAVKGVLKEGVRLLDLKTGPERDKWDGAVKAIYGQVFDSFRSALEGMRADVISGKLSRVQTDFLKGKFSTASIGNAALCRFTDGRTIEERLREDMQKETRRCLEEWRKV